MTDEKDVAHTIYAVGKLTPKELNLSYQMLTQVAKASIRKMGLNAYNEPIAGLAITYVT